MNEEQASRSGPAACMPDSFWTTKQSKMLRPSPFFALLLGKLAATVIPGVISLPSGLAGDIYRQGAQRLHGLLHSLAGCPLFSTKSILLSSSLCIRCCPIHVYSYDVECSVQADQTTCLQFFTMLPGLLFPWHCFGLLPQPSSRTKLVSRASCLVPCCLRSCATCRLMILDSA